MYSFICSQTLTSIIFALLLAAFISKILRIKYVFKLERISKKESLKPVYNSGENIFRYLCYKPRFKNLNQMLKSNIKWFKRIY